MSFVNEVMAEEADRKGLILFEDYSSLQVIDTPPVRDQAGIKVAYWRNFLLALIGVMILLRFIDQLPIRKNGPAEGLSEVPRVTEVEAPTIETVDRNSLPNRVARKNKQPVIAVVADASLAEERLRKNQASLDQTPPVPESPILETGGIKFEKKTVTGAMPLTEETAYRQAEDLLQKGQIQAAINQLRKRLEQNRQDLAARLLLASTLIRQHENGQAMKVYQQGLVLFPGEPRFAEPLAHLLVDQGKIVEALDILYQAAPDVHTNPEYHSFIAALEQQTGRHRNAIGTYRKILQLEKGNGKWWLGLGISLMAEGHDAEARLAFEKSIHDPGVSLAMKQFAIQRIRDLKKRGHG